MGTDDPEQTPPHGTPKPALAISAWEPKKIKGEPTGQMNLSNDRFRAPPPSGQMVSFSPPAPSPHSGNTNPGPSTRVDSPHPKQKTPKPQAPPKAPAPVSKPRVANPIAPPPVRMDQSGSAPITPKPSARPPAPPPLRGAAPQDDDENTPPNGIPLGPAAKTGGGAVDYSSLKLREGAPVRQQDEPRIPNIRQIPSYSRFSFLFPESPLKMGLRWAAITFAILAPISFGIIRCQQDKEPDRIEQAAPQKESEGAKKVEKEAKPPKPVSHYVPKALRYPPQVPNRIPHRVARNSLRA